MLYKVGIIILFIGLMMGDSESLALPLMVIALGCGLICIGSRKEGCDDRVKAKVHR